MILSTLSDDGEEDKEERIRQIKTLAAFDLFGQLKFKEALNLFFQLNIDPRDARDRERKKSGAILAYF